MRRGLTGPGWATHPLQRSLKFCKMIHSGIIWVALEYPESTIMVQIK